MTAATCDEIWKLVKTLDEKEGPIFFAQCAAVYLRTMRDEGDLAAAIAWVLELDGLDGLAIAWIKGPAVQGEAVSRDGAAPRVVALVDAIGKSIDKELQHFGHGLEKQ